MLPRLIPMILLLVVGLTSHAGGESSDSSKLGRQSVEISTRGQSVGKNKLCCGYPLAGTRGFALRFYWLALQERYLEHYDEVDIYTRKGFYLGSYPQKFLKSLKMEGSGLLADGRVINYAGRCRYGTGTCYQQLDPTRYPYGRGAGRRSLIPFKSVAVDRRLIPIGEPIYIPEFDGLLLPDGTLHDGCVRADDTGGGIKKRKMDFFVVSYPNFRFLLRRLRGVNWITPVIEEPRCQYLRDR